MGRAPVRESSFAIKKGVGDFRGLGCAKLLNLWEYLTLWSMSTGLTALPENKTRRRVLTSCNHA